MRSFALLARSDKGVQAGGAGSAFHPRESAGHLDSLLVTRKLPEGQLIANHEMDAPRGVVKLANAKNAA